MGWITLLFPFQFRVDPPGRVFVQILNISGVCNAYAVGGMQHAKERWQEWEHDRGVQSGRVTLLESVTRHDGQVATRNRK